MIDNEKSLPEIEAMEGPVYTLKPHTAYLASIKRKVKIPKGYTMLYLPRSTLLRSFVSVQTAVGDPGFYGTLMFMIYNHGEFDYKIKSGDRIAQAVVFPVEGSGEYNGSYQEEEWFLIFLNISSNDILFYFLFLKFILLRIVLYI